MVEQAVASLPASFNSLHAAHTQSIFTWSCPYLQQKEEGTRCPRTIIKSSTTLFTPRWCKMSQTTQLQVLHHIPAVRTCCPGLNPLLSSPKSGNSGETQSSGIFKPSAFKTTKQGFCFNTFLNKPPLCFFKIRLLTWGRLEKQHLLPDPLQGSQPGMKPTSSVAPPKGNPFWE